MSKRDPIREYMAAHPERVHGSVVEVPVRRSRARDAIPSVASGGATLAGWCSITHEPVLMTDRGEGVAFSRHRHPGRPGCVILNRMVERDGLWHAVEPDWDDR